MEDIKPKHPNWFKLKLERRELLRQLSPETAINVLLYCLDYIETGKQPDGLSPIEAVAFSAFKPDLSEAWSKYLQRISARGKNRMTSYDTEAETEAETEVETETESEEK